MPPRVVEGPERLGHTVIEPGGVQIGFEVAATDFWQVHPAAPQTFVTTVLRELAPRPGEVVLDLYCGAGLFTAVLAHAVGPTGQVVGIESDPQSVADATANLAGLTWAQARSGRVSVELLDTLDLAPDLVVVDPPRSGLGPKVMAGVVALGARAIAYVSCDPASLARDVGVATKAGWRLDGLSAYDSFPMTHHIECIAILTPN
jgi:tRNA/tmRNA/rRNA uracil-C5-methylase (TrmA/RlmC/RlmD family)